MSCVADRLVIQIEIRGAISVAQALAVGISSRRGRQSRQVDVLVSIKIPLTLAAKIRIMRLDQGHRQHEGLVSSLASVIKKIAPCLEDRFIIVVEIHRSHAGPGLCDDFHVVKPVKTFFGLIPFRMPGEIRGVHIGGEALPKTV